MRCAGSTWGRALLPAALALAVPVVAAAQAQPPTILDQNILTAVGPLSNGVPLNRPYFLGWSLQITPNSGLLSDILKLPREPGGVGADPSSGRAYVGSRDGRLVCVEGGRIVWSIDIGGELLAPAKVYKDVVIAATAEGVVYVVNKVTGQRRARSILGEELITQPVVLDDGAGHVHAFVGSSAESLFAINVDDGLKLWRVHRDAPSGFTIYGFARPVVTPTAVYAGFADGVLEALDPATGATRWEKRLSPPGDMLDVDALAYNNVTLFATSYSGGVFALDPKSGNVLWQKKVPQVNRLLTDGQNVYAGGPGQWTALRGDDGFVLWRHPFADGRAQTLGVLTDRLLVFAPEDGPMLFVDKRTGASRGQLPVGDGFSSPPAMVGNVMFAFSNYGRVYSAVIAP
jgi:outer membrane protein assembly factor BamB